MSQDALLPHPECIGPYHIESVLGQGGMGTVFLGRDQNRRPAAIKLATGLDERGRRRFEREVGACRRLDHPGIVKVLDLGLHEGQPWYAMEYHSAVSLAQLLACSQSGSPEDLPALIAAIERGELSPAPPHCRRLLPRTVAIDMMIGICAAVVHAHSRGLIHRDLKPENILLDPAGQTLVADFGLVVDLDQQRRLTQTGGVIGTFGYAAPEALQAARTLDERADVYALGVILRELLTGIPPGPDALRPATGGARLQPDRQRLARLPRPLRVVIERATHPRADRRYHSALALLADLQRFQRGDRVLARRDPWWSRLRPWFARHRGPAAALLLLGLSAGALGVRAFMLQRLEASRWGDPLLDLRADQDAGIAQLLDPLQAPDADVPVAGADRLLAAPAPVFGDQRIRADFRTGGPGARIGVHLAAADDGSGGYRLELPVAGNEPARLSRGAEVLWLADRQLEAESAVSLELELHDHVLSAHLDHRELVHIIEPIPRFGGMAGATIRPAGAIAVPTCTGLSLRGRTLPRFQPASWLTVRLVGLLRDSEPSLRRTLWDEVRTTCEEHLQRSDGAPAARHLLLSAWSAIAALPPALRPDDDTPDLTGAIETVAGSFPAAGRDLRWHRTRARALLPLQPGRSDDLLAFTTGIWRTTPGQRDALLLWLLNTAAVRDAGSCLDHAVELARSTDHRGPAALLLAERVLDHVCWNPPARAWAAGLLATAPTPGPARHEAWWRERLGAPPLPAGPTEARPSAAGAAWRIGAMLPERASTEPVGAYPQRSIAELVLGAQPELRFAAIEAPSAWTPAERRWLTAAQDGLLPPPAAWDVPALHQEDARAALRAWFADPQPVGDLVAALAAAGDDPLTIPWHRIAAAGLVLRPHDPAPRALLAAQPQCTQLDLPALGLLRLAVAGISPPGALVARARGEMAPVLALLADPQNAPPARAPSWHPSRPLLDLALAVALLRGNRASAGLAALERLATASPAWPEALAADLLRRSAMAGDTPW